MKLKKNKDRANEEFVRAVSQAIHDRLVKVIQSFPDFDAVSPFYRDIVDIMWGLDRVRKALGGVGWAARWARTHGPGLAYQTRKSENPSQIRKRAVARLSSVVHQVEEDLLFLNEVRNVVRKLPHVSDEFTVVVAGYPNVGKSSFIRLVSTAVPEVASYPFTTKGIIVGHRNIGRGKIQFVDTPGILDRPAEERNAIEKQALSAMMNIASVVLFILDPSEHCGYPMDVQLRLLEEVRGMVKAPLVVVANKSDITTADGYTAMSTQSGDGVDVVLESILGHRPKRTEAERIKEIRAPIVHAGDVPEIDPLTGRVKRKRVRRPRKPRTKTG